MISATYERKKKKWKRIKEGTLMTGQPLKIGQIFREGKKNAENSEAWSGLCIKKIMLSLGMK